MTTATPSETNRADVRRSRLTTRRLSADPNEIEIGDVVSDMHGYSRLADVQLDGYVLENIVEFRLDQRLDGSFNTHLIEMIETQTRLHYVNKYLVVIGYDRPANAFVVAYCYDVASGGFALLRPLA